MMLSQLAGAWLLRIFPPLLFNRVWIKKFGKDYRTCEVKIIKSLVNINLNKSIFGGTIFSAADPIYAIMFWQVFARKGLKVQTWLKSAHIQYKKPANTSLYFRCELPEDDIIAAEKSLHEIGKFVKSYKIEIVDKHGEVCAEISTEVYIRNLWKGQQTVSGF